MSSNKERQEERQARLVEWLKTNPQEWLDIADEVKDLIDKKLDKLIQPSCLSREFTAGECAGFHEVLRTIDEFKG